MQKFDITYRPTNHTVRVTVREVADGVYAARCDRAVGRTSSSTDAAIASWALARFGKRPRQRDLSADPIA